MNSNDKNRQKVENGFWKKVRSIAQKVPFINDAFALYRYMRDPAVHPGRKVVAVGALIYFICPWDAIPDFVPVVGYMDDAGVIYAAVEYYSGEIEPHYENIKGEI